MKTHFPDKREGYEESIKFKLSTEINKCFINTILSEYSGKCSQKSKLINGLKHWDKNSFKKLWLSSFFHDSAKKVSKYIFTHQPFQYWSQGTIPSDLLKLQRMWNSELDKIGIRPIKTFDKLSAHQWIKNNVPELQIAFETAPHYAVESDVFRVAYASQNDCIYLDIDSYVLPKSIDILVQKITSAKTTLLFAPSRPYF